MKFFAAAARKLTIVSVALVMMVATFFLNTADASASEVMIIMGGKKGLVFEPAIATIKAGDTVTWKVGALPPHNVQFNKTPGGAALGASLSHKGLEGKKGKSFSVTFPADAPAGEYDYFCMPHRGAGMVGKIIVG